MEIDCKEFLDIQATIECGFTLKRVRDMIITYSHTDKWKELTSDMKVISTVSGMPINIASSLPIINKYQYPFNDKEDAFIESEIQNLLKKGDIRNSSHKPGEFISPIFLRDKIS